MPVKWRTNLTTMPKEGRFEVMQIKEVFRYDPKELRVIDPVQGRIFMPAAWRPLPKSRKPRRKG